MNYPNNPDAEAELIGAVLCNNEALLGIPFIRADHFYYETHREIWLAIEALTKRGEVANPVTLKTYLSADRLQALGGTSYLAKLASSATTVLNAPSYGREVVEMARKRRLMALGSDLSEEASDPAADAASLVAQIMASLTEMAGEGVRPPMDSPTLAMQTAQALDKPLPCYLTGLPTLDEAMGGGLYQGKMYAFAARKKVGKTIMLGTISQNLNLSGVPHLFIAMEMTPVEIEQRAIARHLGINSIAFLKRDNPHLPARVVGYARQTPKNVIYEAAAGASMDDLRRIIATAVVRHKIKGFILDYWQLVGGKKGAENEATHLSNVAQALAEICKKHDLFCAIAVQLNTEGNSRGSEGIKLACDQYYTLHREKGENTAWLQMEESRYTLYQDIGSDITPGLRLNQHGPHFEDCAAPSRMSA